MSSAKMQYASINNLPDLIEKDGFAVIENVVPPGLLAELKRDLEFAIEEESKFHGTREYRDFGMVLFCPIYGDSFLKLLELQEYIHPIESVIGENSILYSYTSSSMPPNSGNYSCRIHYDALHTIPRGYVNKFQTLLAIDDFTLENGATYVLPRSHNLEEPPSEETFFENSVRLTMKAGSVWYGHPKIYHAGAQNRSSSWRHALTTVWCKAYMKQRLDVPRLMGDQDLSHFSSKLKQKLGFMAQVPASYEEYYAPPEFRKFSQPLE